MCFVYEIFQKVSVSDPLVNVLIGLTKAVTKSSVSVILVDSCL